MTKKEVDEAVRKANKLDDSPVSKVAFNSHTKKGIYMGPKIKEGSYHGGNIVWIKKLLDYARQSEKEGDYDAAAFEYRSAGMAARKTGNYNIAERAYDYALSAVKEDIRLNGLTRNRENPHPERLEDIEQELAEIKKEKKGYKSKSLGLEKATATASIVGIIGGLFFLSSNITGNAIANVSQNSSNILGAVLLVVGLVAGFFWVKKK